MQTRGSVGSGRICRGLARGRRRCGRSRGKSS